MTRLVIIQKDDDKSLRWAHAAKGTGLELLPQTGTPINAPLFLLKTTFRRGVPAGYVVRYLNDYPLLAKTLLRLVAEIALVLLCGLLRVSLFWICHNVDKESSAHHPRISRLRRQMFANRAQRVFVTDPLLVPHAKRHFPAHAQKITAITFGRVDPSGEFDHEEEQIAVDFLTEKLAEAKAVGLSPVVLLCTGAPAEKSLHFDYLEALLIAAQQCGYRAICIVAGEFSESARGRALVGRYRTNCNIYIFPHFTRFTPEFIAQYVDFYWRGYDDWSVPFTIYEAATFRKPVLALEAGFLPELVKTYGLGITTTPSFERIRSAFQDMRALASTNPFDDFLDDHDWSTLSRKLNEVLDG